MSNYVYIAASIDGYIARKNGELDWLDEIPNPDGGDFGFAEFMEKVDALVMGRKTFEKVLTFGEWPYSKPVFVLTKTLQSVPENLASKAEIINGEVKEVFERLSERGYKNLYIDGGATIRSFLMEGMIDEMIITRIPVVLGDGIPLFMPINREIKFEHLSTVVYNNNLVKTHYKAIGRQK